VCRMPKDTIATKQKASITKNVKLFLRTILGKRHQNIPLNVNLDGEDIVVNVPKAHAKAMVDAITQDPRKNLPYKIVSSQPGFAAATTDQETISTEYDLPALDSVENAKQIMLNLFGKKAFVALKLDLDETFKNARFVDGVLYLQTEDDRDIADVFLATQKYLLSYFLNRPRSKIQDAWLGKDTLTKQKLPTSSSVIPQGSLTSCFGVSQQSGAEMFINLQRLQNLIFPPKITQQALPDDTVNLRFKTNHFYPFMQQFSEDGMLLRLTGSGQQGSGRPLILGSTPKPGAKKPSHRILVDLSGSMQNVLPDAKVFLAKLVKRSLKEGAPEVIVTGFGNNIGTPMLFNQNSQESEINQKINDLQLMGGTGLYDAILSQLGLATPAQLAGEEEFTLTLISDGKDNLKVDSYPHILMPYSSEERERFINQALTSIKNGIARFSSSKPAKISIVGLGDPKEIDHVFLKDLALISGTTYDQIKDIKADLEKMLDSVSDLFTSQDHLQLAIEIAGKGRKSYKIRVPANGQVQMPDITFPFNKGDNPIVTFNGAELLINSNIDEMQEPDLLDHLANIKTEARRIVMDMDLSLDDKSQRLAKLRDTAGILRKSGDANALDDEMNEIDDFLQHIETKLNNAKTDPASFSSFQTYVRQSQGMTEEEPAADAQCTLIPGGPLPPCEVDGVTPAKHNSGVSKTVDATIPNLLKWTIPYTAATMVRNWFRGTPAVTHEHSKPPKKVATTATVHASLAAQPVVPPIKPSITVKPTTPKAISAGQPPAAPQAPSSMRNSTPIDLGKSTTPLPSVRPAVRSYAMTSAPAPLSLHEKVLAVDATIKLLRPLGFDVTKKVANVLDTVLPSHWQYPLTTLQFDTLNKHRRGLSDLSEKLVKNGNDEYLKMYGFDGIEPAKAQLYALQEMIDNALKTGKINQVNFDAINEMHSEIENVIRRTNEIIDVVMRGCKRAKKNWFVSRLLH